MEGTRKALQAARRHSVAGSRILVHTLMEQNLVDDALRPADTRTFSFKRDGRRTPSL
jgi:hypothetical protein